ncbi:MAG: type II CRISPR RNA-guided endonuclease Cas9 [Campylobacteraceae bacterium]
MSKLILGLDIGITSIGWAVVEKDEENSKNSKILSNGVRLFTQSENPKDGSSLALPRREARGSRRVTKRKRTRLNEIKNLFGKYLDIPFGELKNEENLFIKKVKKIDVWQLRAESLTRVLNEEEFARVLTHIAKHRGYKSNRKSLDAKEKDVEKKQVLNAINHNKELLEKFETIGEAIFKTTPANEPKRNKPQNYSKSISREMLENEVDTIFLKQQNFDNKRAIDEFKNKYKEVAFKQKALSSIEGLFGKCTFEKEEPRAAKNSFSAEEFVTLSKLINTKLIYENMDERHFTKDEILKLMDVCKTLENPSFSTFRKTINLDDNIKFKSLDYLKFDEKTGEIKNPESEKFKNGFIGFHSLRKVVEKTLSKTHWHNISQDKNLLNKIALIFSTQKNEEIIKKELEKLSFLHVNEDEKKRVVDAFLGDINFSKFNNLSIKAIEKLLPCMYEAKRYDEAVSIVYQGREQNEKAKFLRVLNDDENNELTNPVVKRAISQTRKVVNALIRKYGSFDALHVELTRDVKKSFKDRKKIEKEQKEFQENKERLVKDFIEKFDKTPKGAELEKYTLWREQNGQCIYSIVPIKIERLLEIGYCEIDHIFPYSRSWDNSKANRVLCLAKENQEKKNKTPFEYFSQNGKDWEKYKASIASIKTLSKSKFKRLLKENFDENSENEFKNRSFNDTAFATRFIKNFIENSLQFRSSSKKPVVTINGMLTSNLRHQWGIDKKDREKSHLHHAEDATIIAFTSRSEVQKFATISAKIDSFSTLSKEEKKKEAVMLPPFENFRATLEAKLSDVFVSFAPRRKVTGAAHKETIYSKKEKKDGFEVNKGLAEFGEIKRVDVFQKDGKIHFIYLYSNDFLKKELPNKSIKGILIDDSFEFLFSVFKDEYIVIKQKGKDEVGGYFKYALSDGRIVIIEHNIANFDANKFRYSTGSLEWIKKYHIGVLGEKNEVKKEKRVGTKRMK